MVAHDFIPVLGKVEAARISEFKASLAYKASSRIIRATQRNAKNKKTKKQKTHVELWNPMNTILNKENKAIRAAGLCLCCDPNVCWPGLSSHHHINWTWQHTAVIPALRVERERLLSALI